MEESNVFTITPRGTVYQSWAESDTVFDVAGRVILPRDREPYSRSLHRPKTNSADSDIFHTVLFSNCGGCVNWLAQYSPAWLGCAWPVVQKWYKLVVRVSVPVDLNGQTTSQDTGQGTKQKSKPRRGLTQRWLTKHTRREARKHRKGQNIWSCAQ